MKGTVKYLLLATGLFFYFVAFISKVYIVSELPLSIDSIQPAIIFYDIVHDHNYLLKNWYLPPNPYLFTDFHVYLVLGIVYGMDIFSIKAGAFIVFLIAISLFGFLNYRIFNLKVAIISTLAMLSAPLFPSFILLQPYTHIATIGFSFLSLFIVCLVLQRGLDGKGVIFCSLILLVLSVLVIFSDPYFIFVFVAPVSASYIVLRGSGTRLTRGKTEIVLMLTLILMTAGGMFLPHLVKMFGPNLNWVERNLISVGQAGQSFSLYLQGIAKLFDMDLFEKGIPVADMPLKVVNLLLFLLVFANGFLVARRETDGLKKFVMIYFIMTGILLSAGYLIKQIKAERYIIPFSFIFALFFAQSVSGQSYRGKKLFALLVIFLFSVSAANNVMKSFYFKAEQPYVKLARELEKAGLKYGYSHLAYSMTASFFSDNRVRVRPVLFDRISLEPHYWFAKSDWYKLSHYNGPTFLMVPKKEGGGHDRIVRSYYDPYIMKQIFGEMQKTLDFKDVVVYVWPYNIMRALLRQVEISERSPHAVGGLERTLHGVVLHSVQGERGFLLYGNYWTLKEGRYRVKFVVQATGAMEKEAAFIEVARSDLAAAGGYRPELTRKAVKTSGRQQWVEYDMDFHAAENTKGNLVYEFRVFVTGEGDVRLARIYLEER